MAYVKFWVRAASTEVREWRSILNRRSGQAERFSRDDASIGARYAMHAAPSKRTLNDLWLDLRYGQPHSAYQECFFCFQDLVLFRSLRPLKSRLCYALGSGTPVGHIVLDTKVVVRATWVIARDEEDTTISLWFGSDTGLLNGHKFYS